MPEVSVQTHLARFVTDLDLEAIARDLGRLGVLFAGVMVVPCAVAVAFGEWPEALAFATTAAGSAAAGRLSRSIEGDDLGFADALVVCALAYLGAAVLGGVPFLLTLDPVDAVFEAMSGFTTTGLSAYEPAAMADLPASIGFYRGWIQFVGGAGIVSLSLAVLLVPGTDAYKLSIGERGGRLGVASVLETSRTFVAIYTGLTVAVWVGYAVGGMGVFDGLVHAMATTATGGFSPWGDSLAHVLDRPLVQAVAAAGMFAGALSLPLYVAAWNEGPRRLFADPQVRALVAIIAGASVLLAWSEGAVWPGVLHAVSAATTTGFSVTDPAAWSDTGKLVAIPVMLMGTPTNSSGGGLKLLRVLILVAAARQALWRTLLPPEARVPLTVGPGAIAERELSPLLALLGLYIALFFGGALWLAIEGVPAIDALFESASALATTGLSSGPTLQVSWAGRLVLTGLMWAGRLETLPVLVLVFRVGRWATHPRREP